MSRPGSARRWWALGAALAMLGCAGSQVVSRGTGELVNPFLGPSLSQWLVGAVATLATAEERQAYLELRDDAAAERFIEAFWRRRDPRPEFPGNPLRELFEERSAEADRRFSESGYLGRRTDRGAVFVLFGEPEEVEFEISPVPDGPPIEVWTYPDGAPPGLAGVPPLPRYRFIKSGDLTVFYRRRPTVRPSSLPGSS